MKQDLEEMLETALRHHQTGGLAETAQLYREILAVDPCHADSLHGLGVMAYHDGSLESAAALMGQAINLKQDVPSFHHNLGLVFSKQGKLDEAVACFERALLIDPNFAEAFGNLGSALRQQGKLAEAEGYCRRAITIRPDDADAHLDLGAVFFERGNLNEAAACCARALAIKPEHSEAHYNQGAIFSEQGKIDEATACYERAIALRPDYADAHSNLGSIFFERGKLDEAEACYERVLAIWPDRVDVQYNLGALLNEKGKLHEAAVSIEPVLAPGPDEAKAHRELGRTFYRQGRKDKATACFRRALAINPDYAEAHYSLGVVLAWEYKSAEAIASYERVLAIRPDYEDAHYAMAFVQLQSGDLDRGWRAYERHRRVKDAKAWNFASPPWEGDMLRGRTLLLHSEQGLGDSIQFVRYAGLAKAKGGRVLLSCPPVLVRLFKGVEGIDEVFPNDRAPPAGDCHSSLMSLPYLFGTTLATIPAAVPYLKTDPDGVELWKERLAFYPGLKVGVVWRGNPTHNNNRNRSMPAAMFAACVNIPGVTVVSLQKDAKADEIRALGLTGPFLDAGPLLGDFADTASCVANLDLVITVDTSVCHLAGALGVPVWTLIPLMPDWRWLLDREDSPWYPTMRLFRHPASGDWLSVVERVREALRDIAFGRRLA